MSDQRRAHLGAGIDQQRENSFRQTAFPNAFAHQLSHQFTGARVGRMRLDDDGISRRERRGGVSAGHREGQRKVARAENHHRAQSMQHRAQIRLGRLTRRISPVNPRHHPRAFFHYFREQTKLPRGAAGLTLQARFRQGGFLLGAIDKLIDGAINFGRDGPQELSFVTTRYLAVGCERLVGQVRSPIYFLGSRRGRSLAAEVRPCADWWRERMDQCWLRSRIRGSIVLISSSAILRRTRCSRVSG